MHPDPGLTGKVAVVTGASRGLGEAIAAALSGAGARVALVARDGAKLANVRAKFPGSETFLCDITKEADVMRLEREVTSQLGPASILINNAGINKRKKLEDFTLEEFHQVMDTSVTGSFLMCRAFVPHMKSAKYGRIVNLCSTMSHVSLPMRTAYSAAKAGLLGFTKALALELADEGITVNAISPGPFATEMNTTLMNDAALNAQFLSNIPLGRWGKVEEVGALACYLCSSAAGFITGTDILIDGGWTAR